jgi:hypothetical protein
MSKINWKNHFIELIIVIIGISVAFWLNNLASESRERELEASFISDLRLDLKKDSSKLEFSLKNNDRKIEALSVGLSLIQTDTQHIYSDSLFSSMLQIGNYNFFVPENLTITSLLQSGDFKMIRSTELKKELLRLQKIYEQIDWSQKQLLQALDDNYFPLILNKVDMVAQTPIDPDFFYSIEVKNYCAFSINDTQQHNQFYKSAIKQLNKLFLLMD